MMETKDKGQRVLKGSQLSDKMGGWGDNYYTNGSVNAVSE